MDADHFDTLAKRLVIPTTRRATLGALAAGGLLSALGLGRAVPATRAAQGRTCSLAFAASVRLGPSVAQLLTPNGTQPGELRGDLRFALSDTGALEQGALLLRNGTRLPVVGQATGSALQVRIEIEPRVALVAVGVGEREIRDCTGAIDGVVTGPQVGDLGDWHAAASDQTGGTRDTNNTVSGHGQGDRTTAERTGRSGAQAATAGTTPTSGTRGAADACPSGLTHCGSACVDLNVERNHCGACGEVCPGIGGLVCAGGHCGCPAGWTDCSQAPSVPEGIDGYCADLDSDAGNCGACGFPCATDQTCVNGKCQRTGTSSAQCASGLTDCDGVCVDLASNTNHCGACDAACESGLVPVACRSGVCERATCPPDEEYCGAVDGCRDLQSDPDHCGACQRRCTSGACAGGSCANGGATCPSGQADCGEGCTDLSRNDFHCGACGHACDGDVGQVCQGGVCTGATCTAGLTDCAGSCVDLQSDPFHCGVCGTVCPGAETDANPCIAGSCVDQCTAHGLANCSGGCSDLSSDPANCGACGTACAGGQVCQGGVCSGGSSCAGGLTDCSGVCVNLTNDVSNCGICGRECAYGEVCSGGACQSSCGLGLSYCNGGCVDTARDPSNCGGCGSAFACPAGQVCQNGGCIASHPCPVDICADACVDTARDPKNCGACGNDCAGSECVSGVCTGIVAQVDCAALGLVNCGGICVDVSSDPANCGVCGYGCGDDACVNGICVGLVQQPSGFELTCADSGLTDCGGVCVDLLTDDFNCGSCGNRCDQLAGYCLGDGTCCACCRRPGDPSTEPVCSS